jgi:hypothetical protein
VVIATPRGETVREDLLGAWTCTEGRLSLVIERRTPDAIVVTVWLGLGERVLVAARPARYRPRDPDAGSSSSASARLDRLEVELGDVNLGPTYTLLIAGSNDDPSAWGGFAARPLLPKDAPEDVSLFPEAGASYYEAVLGYYDDVAEAEREAYSWRYPLGQYRRASAVEAAALGRRATAVASE